MEKSILHAKITVSHKELFENSVLNIIYALKFHVIIMSQILLKYNESASRQCAQ